MGYIPEKNPNSRWGGNGGGNGGGVRIWNFQGYQTNRMWNFQELIKNDMECNLFQMVETKKK